MFLGPTEREKRSEDLTKQIRDLASQISALQAKQVGLVAELEEVFDVDATLPQWIAWQAGLTNGEARSVVRLSRRLEELPVLREAFESGRLSQGTVSTLLPVATPDNEATLLETSQVATASQLGRLVGAMKSVEKKDSVVEREEFLNFGHDDNGSWWLRGSLRSEWGAQIETALRVAQDIDRERGEPLVTSAEALMRVVGGFMDNHESAGSEVSDRYRVIVRVDSDAVGNVDGHIVGAKHIEAHTIEELLCESYLSVVLTKHGKPVTVANPGRFASVDQRRALVVRDGGCRFPGCGRTKFLKAHHLVRHLDGGPTSLDNMILLCQGHHTLIHKPGWKVGFDDDGHLAFIDKWGRDRAAVVERPPPRGDIPPAGPRNWGTGERMTSWAANVLFEHWMAASKRDGKKPDAA